MPPGWGICLCVCFSRGLRNFRIERDWVTFESLRTRMCLAVWSRELHMGRDAEECLSENPGSRFYRSWPLCLWVSVRVHWPVLVSSTRAQHWSSWYESPRCQHHDVSAALGCGPNGVTPTLFSFPHFAALTRGSSCHCSSLARTWSWCRPKKEDWLKKKDRYQRRPGCGRKKSEPTGWAPVLGPSGAACQSRWAPVLGPALACSLSLTVILSFSQGGRDWVSDGSSDPGI